MPLYPRSPGWHKDAIVKSTSEAAFEIAIDSVLLGDGYTRVAVKGFDRERAVFPDEALAFIHATQAKVWEKLEALHDEQTGERVLESLCKWLDTHGTLATRTIIGNKPR